MTKILIVDDDPVQVRLAAEIAMQAGFSTLSARNGREALEKLRSEPELSAMVLDLVMPELDGLGVLEAMAREAIAVPVIVASSNAESVAGAMQHGATDFFIKPATAERLGTALRNVQRLQVLEALVRQGKARQGGSLAFADIVTRSPDMLRVVAQARKAARGPIPVLVEGETGTGREFLARAIHGSGDRAGKPFVTFDCAGVALHQIDAALFGQRGMGTNVVGKFSEAHGGTLYLDAVGDLPPATQEKLLRAMQYGEIEPVGSSRIERINVRVITATNRRLLNLAKAGEFREDLYYRLNVFPIYMPPLRERKGDIAGLVGHFIARHAAEAGRRVAGIAGEALELLEAFDWPGNVRQLDNAVYRAVILSESAVLELADFPQILALSAGRSAAIENAAKLAGAPAPIHIDQMPARPRPVAVPLPAPDRFITEAGEVAQLADIEKALIVFALERHSGRMSQVARALGIGRSTLYRKLKEYGLDDDLQSDAA